MEIPLEKRLRKQAHRDIGRLQDEAMEILYALEDGLVLHGGTAIWRCFGGGRFSEDLDLYLPRRPEGLGRRLGEALASHGLGMDKYKETPHLVYCKVSDGRTQIRVEINFSKKPAAEALPYERLDGSRMVVRALGAEALMEEKTAAYLSRRFIRDMYDLYILAGRLEEGRTPAGLARMLQNPPPPADEANLAVLVYSGAVPTFAQMLLQLKRRFG